MKKVDVIYQPSMTGHQHYTVVLKNGDIYYMNCEGDSYYYVGVIENLPNAREERRINKAHVDDKLKKAIADRMRDY